MSHLRWTATPFRWYPHDGVRHAIPAGLKAGDSGMTLCGEDVTLPAVWPILRCEPECSLCDNAWRRAIGVQTRNELLARRPGEPSSHLGGCENDLPVSGPEPRSSRCERSAC
ncbi:zinc finger protein [Saccharothrix australiensis]|uniref:zinc finger protein n=1 Tax=Saccharothrix australiensis TaxID=2072 RepID=UPI001FE7F9A5|nr:zinc finger protein [Saccharothrix australiensis]